MTPPAGVLHLVRARLDTPPVARERLVAVLSEAERERVARFRFPALRRRHEVALGLLRTTLAGFVGADPAALRFELGEHGKPSLPGGPSFNLSHSGDWWLLGIADGGRVGVDVEVHRPLTDLAEVARTTFHPAEADEVLAREGAARQAAFFRVWSRKEAFIKAVGLGLSYPLRGFRVSASDDPAQELLAVDDPAEDAGRWHLQSVPWAPDLAAAVAWDRPGARVVWSPPPGPVA